MPVSRIIENSIGHFKRWQLYVFLMGSLPNIPLSFHELSIMIIAPPIRFNCSDENIDKCSSECPSHVFDKSVFSKTVTEEFDIVCDKESLQDLMQIILMLGILVGNFLFGYLSDKFGRRKPLIIAVCCEIVSGLLISFSTHLWMFLLLRFLIAVAIGGSVIIRFVLVIEVIGDISRSTCGILFQISYYIGQAFLGLIGYLIRDWRYIQLTISFPIILFVSYYWILPESPRWLLTMRRLEEAIILMEKAAIVNKMPPENIRQNIMSRLQNTERPIESVFDIFKFKRIRTITLCIYLNWVAVGLTFFGVAQFLNRIGEDIFVKISVAGLIQIPTNIIVIFLIKNIGRKKTMVITYTLCVVTCLTSSFAPEDLSVITPYLGSTSMIGISLSFAVFMIWSGELFPTVIRNTAMGSSAMCAKFGSIMAVFIINIGDDYPWFPPLMFTIALALGFVTCLILPETANVRMPDTIEEVEYLGRTGRLGSIISNVG